jgi:hypothetical protein
MENIPYAPATVVGGKGNHAPVLSAGRITIPVIRIFENACRCFFQNKKLAEEERVLSIIYNFESSAVQAWVMTHHDCLVGLGFVEFFTKFKNKFLPANWKDDLVAMQISMQSSQAFLTWTESVREANAELAIAGSDYHISEEKLRAHFVPRLSPALKASYNSNNTHGFLDAITDLEAWIQCVHLLDLENQNKWEEWLKIAQTSAHVSNKGMTSRVGVVPNTRTAEPSAAGKGGSVLSNTTNVTPNITAKLTQAEHDLLRAHRGCFRCRKFYAGHFAQGCPLGANGRPSPEACKNVTVEAALKAKSAFEAKEAGLVAAVFDEGHLDSDDFEISEDEADEYVSNLSLPSHLWWDCCIDAPGTCAPTPVRALIDHGSPPVLISSELVEILELIPRKLFKPFSVSGAFVDGRKSSDSKLTEYCKLRLQSLDSVWKAKVVNTIICPNLHMDIILGLDFLLRNGVVVDAQMRTAIAKSDGYDLLNPPLSTPAPLKLLPNERRKAERKAINTGRENVTKLMRPVLDELNCKFGEDPERFDFELYSTDPPCIISAIRKRIKELSSKKVLEKLDAMYKAKYSDHFPEDIPHAKDLPMDVYHNIEVKPGAPISVGRAYSCPRKYREGWKTLIEQHSKAGHIRPSSSPYASPSFIIPKADGSVLPRWVNDYWKLNKVTVPDNYPAPTHQ